MQGVNVNASCLRLPRRFFLATRPTTPPPPSSRPSVLPLHYSSLELLDRLPTDQPYFIPTPNLHSTGHLVIMTSTSGPDTAATAGSSMEESSKYVLSFRHYRLPQEGSYDISLSNAFSGEHYKKKPREEDSEGAKLAWTFGEALCSKLEHRDADLATVRRDILPSVRDAGWEKIQDARVSAIDRQESKGASFKLSFRIDGIHVEDRLAQSRLSEEAQKENDKKVLDWVDSVDETGNPSENKEEQA